jgi:hypothetical protein
VEIFGPNGRELAPTVKNNNDGSFGVTYQPQVAFEFSLFCFQFLQSLVMPDRMEDCRTA